MGRYEPHTTADELFAEAAIARAAASAEMENWRAHLESMETAAPADQAALAFQARRSERIVSAQLELATAKASEAAQILAQLTVVS